jgi:hypothetical protein
MVIAVLLLSAEASFGQTSLTGRWDIVAENGSTPAQATTGNLLEFQAFFNAAGTGIQNDTFDTAVCDNQGDNNVTSYSQLTTGVNPNYDIFVFNVNGGSGGNFTYDFFTTNPSGPTSPISGWYISTPGGCNAGTQSSYQGNMSAIYYPDITNTYIVTLQPSNGVGSTFDAFLTLTQNDANGSLTGSIALTGSCFVSNLTITNNSSEGHWSDVAGSVFEVYATDTNGNALVLVGDAVNSGSNSAYNVYYSVVGGPCNGQGETDSPMKPIEIPRPRPPIFRHGPIRRINRWYPTPGVGSERSLQGLPTDSSGKLNDRLSEEHWRVGDRSRREN